MHRELVFTVIIPVFNLEDHIIRCLECLRDQTLSQDLFEVVVVDDGSTDKTVPRAKHFRQIKNLKMATSPFHGGPGIARNQGIKAAEGEYIIFLDGDDTLEPHALETLYRHSEEGPDSIAYNWAYMDDPQKIPQKKDFPNITTEKGTFIQNYLGMSVSGDVIYTATKREIFEKHLLSFPGGYHEDMSMIFKMLYLSSKIKKLAGDVLYIKNNRPGSLVNTLTFKHIDGYLGSWPDIMNFLIKFERAAAQKYLDCYLRGLNGLVYTLVNKSVNATHMDDLQARKEIYRYIFSVLKKDEFIQNKSFDELPKETKKDMVAHEYCRLMMQGELSDERVLLFEKKLRSIPEEVIEP